MMLARYKVWIGSIVVSVMALSSGAFATDQVLLVGGLGGEPQYTQAFTSALTQIREELVQGGYDSKCIRTVMETPAGTKGSTEESTLVNLTKEFERLSKELTPADTFLLVMIGHGLSDYQEPRFNLPGPDLTAHVLRGFLDALPATDQRGILIFSCSGHFSEIMSAPTRTLLASTDGPRQIYAPVSAPYLIKALAKKTADGNADGKVSFTELFDFMSSEVKGHFQAAGSLATETPSLEDNGDGKVTVHAEGMDAGDGARAATVFVLPAPSSKPEPKPEKKGP